ncbi:glycosyltransferase family 4 protein [Sunxiuqinia indica]|uniref:glycosyltransferase family 4 protein n=1 Tax=Sunxiuqinia indica TaxID=2692584 RepID=UPI0013570DAD|nr:glycosyltransferase family 4 protein [Sunxiuqinia indica]
MSKRVLLIYSNYSSFVKSDYEILSEKYQVDRYKFRPRKGLFPFLFQFLKQFVHLLINGWKYDVFFIWFADYHSFLPTLFAHLSRKKSIIIVGGFDAVSIPEIEFGVFYKNNLRTKFVRLSYKLTKFILPVDETLVKSTNYYVNPQGQKIGVLNFVENVEAAILVVPTGYDSDFWKRLNNDNRRNVITVGGCSDWKTFRRKGHDFFLDVARSMPEYKFTLCGIAEPMRREIIGLVPFNVKVLGFITQKEMIQQFSNHKVFTQFSLSEGLPNTLCEAMLCGCVPVGSNVNGIPDAIGETGFILENQDVSKAVQLIEEALYCDDFIAPRERIIKLYDIKKRKSEIGGLIESFK